MSGLRRKTIVMSGGSRGIALASALRAAARRRWPARRPQIVAEAAHHVVIRPAHADLLPDLFLEI